MRDRILWYLSLLFIAWMIWVETSFQYFASDLERSLSLNADSVALVGSAFLIPYGLAQIPVGWLLDRGVADKVLLFGGLSASALTLVFSRGENLTTLIVSRAGMGLACAVAFPASGLLARRCLPRQRFALAMGFTDSLLGVGAVIAALIPLLVGSIHWRALVQVQCLLLTVLVTLPLLLLRRRSISPGSSNVSFLMASAKPGHRLCLIQGALIYAWGGGLLFGLGQYSLLSHLQHWSEGLQLQVTLLLSLGITIGMLICGAVGQNPSRRSQLLFAGSFLVCLSLIPLTTPASNGAVQLIFGASFGLGLGSCVLAFPIAEESASAGHTAMVVAFVNTCGTLSGGLMTLISGHLMVSSTVAGLSLTRLVYGSLALAGLPLALWVNRTAQKMSIMK